MNEIYIIDGQKFDVAPNRKDEFLQKYPNATLYKEPVIPEDSGKTTPTAPGAVVEETAAPELTVTESPSVDFSLESVEIPNEEKRKLPYDVSQSLIRSNKQFTQENIDQVTSELEKSKNRVFSERIIDESGIKKFKNLSYNIFGTEAMPAGPMVLSRLQAINTAFVTGLKTLYTTPSTPSAGVSGLIPNLVRATSDYTKLLDKEKKEYKDLIDIKNLIKAQPRITDSDADSLLDVVAGIAGSASDVGVSVVPAMIAGTAAGLVGGPVAGAMAGAAVSNTDILSQFVTDFNIEKAKAENPSLTEEEAIQRLAEQGRTEFYTPAAIAAPAMALEYIGLRGITKYIASKGAITKNLGGLLWASNGEGFTEAFQQIPEYYNTAIAKGQSKEKALEEAVDFFQENFFNTYINAAVGTFAFSGTLKGAGYAGRKAWKSAKNMRVAIDEGNMENKILEIAELQQKKYEAKTIDLKTAIDEQIKTKVEELDGLVVKAASVFNFANDKDFNEINDLEDLKKKYISKVKKINNKKEEVPPEEYKEALNIYKQKYLEAQSRIKGVVSNISDKSNKEAQQVNKLYEEKGKEGIAEILELYRPMAKRIASKYRNVPGFEMEIMTDEILTGERGILDLINSYKPETKVPLSAYVNKFAATRGIEAAQRNLKESFELDVTEAKGITDTTTAETQVETQEQAKAEIKTELAKDLNLAEDTQNEVVTAVEKTLGTKLPAVTDTKFKAALTKGLRTELTNTFKKVFGRTAAYEQFLRDNFEKIYPAIPQETINKKFKEFNEPVLDKEGKQLRERTAEGKKVFKKKDISKAEFIKYFLNAPGNVKGARKTSLAEVMADEIGLDNVLTSLSKSEVVEKFKAIQELQGQEVPSNFIEIISEKIDRAINYLDGLQKNNGVLYSSLIIPELSIAAIKTFLKAAKVALKATNSFAKAIKAGIEAAQELFETKEEKQAVATVLTENYKKAEDLGESSIAEQTTEQTDRALQEIYIPKTVNNLISNLQQSYTENSLENIKNIRRFILLHSKAIRTVASPSKFAKQIPNLTTNKQLFEILNIPKELLGKKQFHLKKSGPGVSIYFGNEKISNPINLTVASERNKVVKDPEGNIDKLNIQSDQYKDLLINEIVRLKNIDKQLAKNMLKVMQLDQQSALRLSGKIGIIFNEGETTNEHNPPIQSIIEKIENFIDDKTSLEDIKNELSNSRQNLVSKEFDKLIPKELKAKASPTRYKKPKEKFKNKYKEYNLPSKKKTLNRQFNEEILQKSKGVEWTKKFSPVEAQIAGKGKGKFKFFIPYSADDFVGLIYATLGKGKIGDQQMEWYKENLLRPFSRGIQQYEAAKQSALREWTAIKKEAKKSVPGGLNKKNDTGLTNQDAVRIYIWKKQNMEIPGTKESPGLIQENLKIVNANKELKSFADRLIALNPEGYPEPSKNWNSGDITTDLVSYIDGVKRSEFLTEFKDNAAEIFSNANKEKLRALYGDNYIEALDDMLHRMKTGTNRRFGASRIEKQFMDWTNNSVGAIMFFNARSAVLQTLSSVNFVNFSDNNPINAGIAFANQPQYWKDFSTLFNSNFLKQRRSGLQTDVNADEIARAAKGSKNTARAALSAILKFGFTPTQIADSFAIASGGATFYRNRINKYKKEGLSQQEAETKAFTDFQEIAEETQQSARPDRISLQQASSLGRLILAFGNTPMQYARLTKKASLDLINGRGDWKTNVSKIMYYSVIQNIIFSALQQGLFALLFDDEDDDKEKSRLFRIGNSSLDTFLRGSGVYGAAAATVKNMILEIIDQQKSGRPDYSKIAIEATAISPPINSKLRKLESAGKTFTYKQSREKVFTEGFSLENPAFLAAGKVISAGTNLPADRVVLKADHLYTAMQPETELWQSLALSLGWSEWDLNMIQNQTKNAKGQRKRIQRTNSKRKRIKR